MISDANFRTAVNVLTRLTSLNTDPTEFPSFGNEYNGQHPITTALKILNKAALDGTNQQKN